MPYGSISASTVEVPCRVELSAGQVINKNIC